MKRIGLKMELATAIVRANPGTCILPVARRIAPYGRGIQYGYAAVHRAIRAGLIRATISRGRYSLTVPE